MGRTFWIISACAALVLALLLTSGDSGEVLGMDTDLFAGVSVTALWGAFIASSLLGRRTNWKTAGVQLAIWVLIILSLMVGYSFFMMGTTKNLSDTVLAASEPIS